MKKKSRNNPKEYKHIAVDPLTKKRFDFLKSFLITKDNPEITQEDLLIEMMDLFERQRRVAKGMDNY